VLYCLLGTTISIHERRPDLDFTNSQVSLDGQFALKFVNLAIRALTIPTILSVDLGVPDANR
jgi:hypothetical protein